MSEFDTGTLDNPGTVFTMEHDLIVLDVVNITVINSVLLGKRVMHQSYFHFGQCLFCSYYVAYMCNNTYRPTISLHSFASLYVRPRWW